MAEELIAARKAAQERAQAETDDAIYRAWHAGLTYARMAKELRVSEGAISAALGRVEKKLGPAFKRVRRQGRKRAG